MKQKNHPKVSVLMSAYRCADYLGEAIESILNQTFKGYEFIIINNASPDNCADIIKYYAKLDTRIRVINNVKNVNFGEVQQQLLEKARGEYLAFAHGDDIYKPERLAKQVKFLNHNTNVGLLSTGFYVFGKNEYSGPDYSHYDDHHIKSMLLYNGTLCISSVMFRSSLVKHKGLKFTSHLNGADDYMFYVNAAALTDLAVIPEHLTGARHHGNNDGLRHGNEILLGHYSVTRAHLSRFGIKVSECDDTLQRFCSGEYSYLKMGFIQTNKIIDIIEKILSIDNFYGYQGISKYYRKHLLFTLRRFRLYLFLRKLIAWRI